MRTSISGEPLSEEAAVARAVAETCPELGGRAVGFLAEGWDFAVYAIDGGWLCRIPKREAAARALALEAKLLPELEPLLGVSVPRFTVVAGPSVHVPSGFAVYRKLEGVLAQTIRPSPGTIAVCAPALTRALTALHGYPVDRAIGLGAWIADVELAGPRQLALDRLARIADRLPAGLAERCLAGLSAEIAHGPTTRALVHADLTGEHLLLDPASLAPCGIIDWGDLAVGDPALDLAGLYCWGGQALARAVWARYGPRGGDSTLLARARFRALVAELHNLHHWLRVGHGVYAGEALESLTRVASGA